MLIPGSPMVISVSSDGGARYIPVNTHSGSESGTVRLNLADHQGVDLTNVVRLRASCLVDANNEICAWDNIKIEAVSNPSEELLVTINSPRARTYGTADFPLTYEVSLSPRGNSQVLSGWRASLGDDG